MVQQTKSGEVRILLIVEIVTQSFPTHAGVGDIT